MKLPLSKIILLFTILVPSLVAAQVATQNAPTQNASTTQDTATLFPLGEVLVILASDKADVLTDPKADSVLQSVYQKYGRPTITQTFPFAGKTQDDANRQAERYLQKKALRQKLNRYKMAQPKIPPLHRFYNLSFGAKAGDVSAILLALKKSPNIKEADPNYILKAMAKAGSTYYSPTLVWAKPYAPRLGLPTKYAGFLSLVTSATAINVISTLNSDMTIPAATYSTMPKIPGTYQFLGRPPILVDSCKPKAPSFTTLCSPHELLVRFKDGVTDATIDALHAPKSITIADTIPLIKVKRVTLPASMTIDQGLAFYAQNSNVLYAEPNYYMSLATTSPNDTDYTGGEQWGLNNDGTAINGDPATADADIDAPEAWDYTTGSDAVVVAVIDTGISYDHEDFYDFGHPYVLDFDTCAYLGGSSAYDNLRVGNIWTNTGEWNDRLDDDDGSPTGYDVNHIDSDGNGYQDDFCGWDFSDTSNTATHNSFGINSPYDLQSHGTGVAGVIGARGNNNLQATGVAWNVKIMALKVDEDGSEMSVSNVSSAITYACSNGAQIANMSFGTYDYPQGIKDALDICTSVLFVAAAGNEGRDLGTTPFYPASFTNANLITVAAADNDDTLSNWSATPSDSSNYSATSVDVAAPGSQIRTLSFDNSHVYSDGTSLAAPFVSGIAALLYSYFPGMDAANAKDLILRSVDVKTGLTGKVATNGRVNAYNAIKLGADEGFATDSGDGDCEVDPDAYNDYHCWGSVKSGCSLTTAPRKNVAPSHELLQFVLAAFFLSLLFIGIRKSARS